MTPQPALEGVDVELEDILRVLRRRREHDTWPARTSSEFAAELRTLADSAAHRGVEVCARLEAALRRHPQSNAHGRALLREYAALTSAADVGRREVPLSAHLARTHHDAELKALVRQYGVGPARVEEHVTIRDALEARDDVTWARAVARDELRALAARPPTRRPGWRWALVAVPVTTLLSVAIGAGAALWAAREWTERVEPSGGSELVGIVDAVAKLLGGVGVSLAAGVCAAAVSFVTLTALWVVAWLERQRRR